MTHNALKSSHPHIFHNHNNIKIIPYLAILVLVMLLYGNMGCFGALPKVHLDKNSRNFGPFSTQPNHNINSSSFKVANQHQNIRSLQSVNVALYLDSEEASMEVTSLMGMESNGVELFITKTTKNQANANEFKTTTFSPSSTHPFGSKLSFSYELDGELIEFVGLVPIDDGVRDYTEHEHDQNDSENDQKNNQNGSRRQNGQNPLSIFSTRLEMGTKGSNTNKEGTFVVQSTYKGSRDGQNGQETIILTILPSIPITPASITSKNTQSGHLETLSSRMELAEEDGWNYDWQNGDEYVPNHQNSSKIDPNSPTIDPNTDQMGSDEEQTFTISATIMTGTGEMYQIESFSSMIHHQQLHLESYRTQLKNLDKNGQNGQKNGKSEQNNSKNQGFQAQSDFLSSSIDELGVAISHLYELAAGATILMANQSSQKSTSKFQQNDQNGQSGKNVLQISPISTGHKLGIYSLNPESIGICGADHQRDQDGNLRSISNHLAGKRISPSSVKNLPNRPNRPNSSPNDSPTSQLSPTSDQTTLTTLPTWTPCHKYSLGTVSMSQRVIVTESYIAWASNASQITDIYTDDSKTAVKPAIMARVVMRIRHLYTLVNVPYYQQLSIFWTIPTIVFALGLDLYDADWNVKLDADDYRCREGAGQELLATFAKFREDNVSGNEHSASLSHLLIHCPPGAQKYVGGTAYTDMVCTKAHGAMWTNSIDPLNFITTSHETGHLLGLVHPWGTDETLIGKFSGIMDYYNQHLNDTYWERSARGRIGFNRDTDQSLICPNLTTLFNWDVDIDAGDFIKRGDCFQPFVLETGDKTEGPNSKRNDQNNSLTPSTSDPIIFDTSPTCGNGILEPWEECELEFGVTQGPCCTNCRLAPNATCDGSDPGCCDTASCMAYASNDQKCLVDGFNAGFCWRGSCFPLVCVPEQAPSELHQCESSTFFNVVEIEAKPDPEEDDQKSRQIQQDVQNPQNLPNRRQNLVDQQTLAAFSPQDVTISPCAYSCPIITHPEPTPDPPSEMGIVGWELLGEQEQRQNNQQRKQHHHQRPLNDDTTTCTPTPTTKRVQWFQDGAYCYTPSPKFASRSSSHQNNVEIIQETEEMTSITQITQITTTITTATGICLQSGLPNTLPTCTPLSQIQYQWKWNILTPCACPRPIATQGIYTCHDSSNLVVASSFCENAQIEKPLPFQCNCEQSYEWVYSAWNTTCGNTQCGIGDYRRTAWCYRIVEDGDDDQEEEFMHNFDHNFINQYEQNGQNTHLSQLIHHINTNTVMGSTKTTSTVPQTHRERVPDQDCIDSGIPLPILSQICTFPQKCPATHHCEYNGDESTRSTFNMLCVEGEEEDGTEPLSVFALVVTIILLVIMALLALTVLLCCWARCHIPPFHGRNSSRRRGGARWNRNNNDNNQDNNNHGDHYIQHIDLGEQ